MALHWNVDKIAKYEERCFYLAAEDDPANDVKKGDRIMYGITELLIHATMFVGLGSITKKNWKQFYARLSLVEKLHGSFRFKKTKTTNEPVYVTPGEVKDHIGLTCNVSDEPKAKWRKLKLDSWEREVIAKL